ncbi:MAG: SRPBCC family protein [Acidimicrobiales bacterium]
MAEQTTERMTIGASPATCFAVVTDFEHYPLWAADVKHVELVEVDDQGRATRVAWRVAAFGRSTSYTLAYDYSEAPEKLSWAEVEGDMTTMLDGSYEFRATEDGETDVVYHLVVDLRVPLPAFVKRRAEGRIRGIALKQLKVRVESLSQV